MNRKAYFAVLGKHTQQQVDGQSAILDEAIRRGASLTLTAYALATAKHETGGTFGPVTENLTYTNATHIKAVWPKRFPTVASAEPYVRNPKGLANKVYGNRADLGNGGGDDGYNFRGRGLAQITGRANYAKWGIEGTPEKALELPTAVRILFDGLTKGMFTGKRIGDYDNYKDMRRAINPDGNGATIAALAAKYEKALREAGYAPGTAGLRPAAESGVVLAPIAVGAASGGNIWPYVIAAGILLSIIIAIRVFKK